MWSNDADSVSFKEHCPRRCHLCHSSMPPNIFCLISLLLICGCSKQHLDSEAAVLGAWRNVSEGSVSGEPNDHIFFTKINGQLRMTTSHSLGFHTIRFSPGNDSITVTQGCLGYKLPMRLTHHKDSLIFFGFIRYVRMDTNDFKKTRRTFLKGHYKTSRLK